MNGLLDVMQFRVENVSCSLPEINVVVVFSTTSLLNHGQKDDIGPRRPPRLDRPNRAHTFSSTMTLCDVGPRALLFIGEIASGSSCDAGGCIERNKGSDT